MISLSEISRDCMDAWVVLCRSLKDKIVVKLRACSVAKMGEILTNPIFAIGLVLMKATLEDFFSWTSHLRARDQARLEAFGSKLVESERLLRSYREMPPSYAAYCATASHRHLQESVIYSLQERQDLKRLRSIIYQVEQLRDS
ncbi:hypothetical protein LIER_20614 [Lithospermum erythrorhizon]|uniref:Uncharacterized protein n=1 Tax=Lithospermum erythrorhizon TaxID=34254 RepID=A0AAV3QQ89_LITER